MFSVGDKVNITRRNNDRFQLCGATGVVTKVRPIFRLVEIHNTQYLLFYEEIQRISQPVKVTTTRKEVSRG